LAKLVPLVCNRRCKLRGLMCSFAATAATAGSRCGSSTIMQRLTASWMLRLSGSLEILGGAYALPELPWMALLGWYVIVMMYVDGAAAATTAATTAATSAAISSS